MTRNDLKRKFSLGLMLASRSMYKYSLAIQSKLDRYANPSIALSYRGDVKDSVQGSAAFVKAELIEKNLPRDVITISDIGGNNGFFSSYFARKNKVIYCFEPDVGHLQRAFFEAVDIPRGNGFMSVSPMGIDENTVKNLPQVDATLLLSVLHYWVEAVGWEGAELLLREIWSKTNKVLFFELPNPVSNSKLKFILSAMGGTEKECELYLVNLLSRLPGATVEVLGYLSTDFRPNEKRHIFAVRRSG